MNCKTFFNLVNPVSFHWRFTTRGFPKDFLLLFHFMSKASMAVPFFKAQLLELRFLVLKSPCMHTLKTSHHWLRALNHKVPCLFKTKTLAAIIILLIENKKQAHSILLNVPCCAAIHFKRSSIPPLNMYRKLHHIKY